MTDTDVFNFNSLKIFDSIKNNLSESAQEISDVFEDLLFVWKQEIQSLQVINWRSTQSKDLKDVKYQVEIIFIYNYKSFNHNVKFLQTLMPSSAPNFSVAKVKLSHGGTFVSISGQHGVSVLELPMRWGVDGVYQDGKSSIICQTFNIFEHSTNHLECIQVRWHPNSPKDSHLLALFSDNSIRMYDESVLKQVWRVGPVPNYAAVEKNLSYLKSLGDTAVDFDIAPAKIRDDYQNETIGSNIDTINNSLNSMSINARQNHLVEQQKKIEWPIVILRGNGTIFLLNAGLNSEQPRLQGPLTVFPSQKLNYGDDYCSLLVIPSLPPTVVMAESSGKMHHLLMMESSPDEDSMLNATKTILRNDWDLYVLETIELELGLSEDKDPSNSPVILKRDPANEQRYFCYHQTGLHGVTIGFIQQLQSYINEETKMDSDLNVRSRAEYILSTKAFTNSMVNAIVGIGLLQSPSGIFAILSSGQIVSLNTIKLSLCNIPELKPSQPATFDREGNDRKIPFDQHIKAILNSSVRNPILKVDKNKPPPSQQAFELLMNAIHVMRDNQFKKHDQVRQEIVKRNKILEFMKTQQKDEIAQLFEDKELIQEKAYKLADMHEDIMERQQNLQKRVQDVLRLASLRLPSVGSEKEFGEQVKRIKQVTQKLLQDLKQIKARNETQRKKIEDLENVNVDSLKALPPKQEETIKEILVDMSNQVANLTNDVKKISSIVDV